MPGFYSDLQHDLDYISLPERINEEELQRRVAALRLGDYSQVNEISVRLMRFVMSLVADFAHPKRTPDLIGVALLTLVETVTAAATRLEDNNILPFVSSHVTHRLKDAIASDHTVCIPSRTLRDWRRRGIEAFVPLTSNIQGFEGVARPEVVPLDTVELLDKIVRNDRDKLYIQLKQEGYGLKVIADSIGVSIGLVHKWKTELRARFQEVASKD